MDRIPRKREGTVTTRAFLCARYAVMLGPKQDYLRKGCFWKRMLGVSLCICNLFFIWLSNTICPTRTNSQDLLSTAQVGLRCFQEAWTCLCYLPYSVTIRPPRLSTNLPWHGEKSLLLPCRESCCPPRPSSIPSDHSATTQYWVGRLTEGEKDRILHRTRDAHILLLNQWLKIL